MFLFPSLLQTHTFTHYSPLWNEPVAVSYKPPGSMQSEQVGSKIYFCQKCPFKIRVRVFFCEINMFFWLSKLT